MIHCSLMFYAVLFFLCDDVLSQSHNDLDVIIVGAGYSGLAAALHLHHSNVTNFVVLEAKNYIGGRVKEVKFAGKTFSYGAAWIHRREENHPVYKLAKKYNLKTSNDNYNSKNLVFRDARNGSTYPEKLVASTLMDLKNKFKKMDELVEKRLENSQCDVDSKTGLSMVGWRLKSDFDKAVEYYFFDFENGVPPDLVSASAYGTTGEGNDSVVIDQRGYSYPIRQEVAPFQNKIITSSIVTEIMRISRMNNKYRVTTQKGDIYYAAHVLITVSSGVLQAGNIKIQPSLPAWKIQSLMMTRMNHYCKIMLQFSEQFWDTQEYIVLATTSRGKYSHWQNFNQPSLYPGLNVLIATLTGDLCYDQQKMTDDEVKQEVYKVLKKVYPNATLPIGMLRNKWSLDPHFLGAYSYQVPGITEGDHAAIKHAVDQSLWFAGEYTIGWPYGDTQAAFITGWRTAKQVVKCMQGICPPLKPQMQPSNSSITISFNFYMFLCLFVEVLLQF